jgi:hypothetical protein
LRQGVATRIENLLRNRDRASPRYVSDYDGSALRCETLRQYPTQSRTAPRHDGNPILEAHLYLPIPAAGINIDETIVPKPPWSTLPDRAALLGK